MRYSENKEESYNETKKCKNKLLNNKKDISDVDVLSFDLCPNNMEKHHRENAL